MAQIILFLLLFSSGLQASDKIIFKAQKDLGGFLAEQSLSMEKNQILLSRNSNFLCAPSKDVAIGLQEISAPLFTSEYREAKLVHQRVKDWTHSIETSTSPHALQFFIGELPINAQHPYFSSIKKILTRACEVSASLKKGQRLRLETLNQETYLVVESINGRVSLRRKASQAGCEERGQTLDCQIARVGQAQLLKP